MADEIRTTEAPDIVLMLRDFCEMGLEGGDSDPLIEVMHSVASQAATEIERLRGALLEIVRTLCAVAREGSGASQMTATWRHTTVPWRPPEGRCGGQAVAIDGADGEPCCAFSYQGKWYFCTNTVDPELEFTPTAWTPVFDMRPK